jgi:hypothetical protein
MRKQIWQGYQNEHRHRHEHENKSLRRFRVFKSGRKFFDLSLQI